MREGTSGFPIERLASAFDRVRDPQDWRAPIEAVILEEDRPLVEQAITCFTATSPTFSLLPEQPGRLIVRAEGYGIGPLAEPVSQGWRYGAHAPTGLGSSRSSGHSEVRYRGFRIVAQPYQVRASRRWIVDLEIHRQGRHRSFTGAQRAPTESDARARCVTLGREIIDGKVPGWTVEPLRRFPSRTLRHTLVAVVLMGSLSAFAYVGDPVALVETVSRWVSSLALLFGTALVVQLAGGAR